MPKARGGNGGGPGYARDPGHTIEIAAEPGRIHAVVGDVLVLREAGYEPVFYFPRADVAMHLLERTERATYCPFKGDAAYWTIRIEGQEIGNAVWSYEAPYDVVVAIKDRFAFYRDKVDNWYKDGEKFG